MSITDQDFLRYQRQIMLPELGEQGQIRLKQAHLLIIGAGGLANAAAPYLAASGIGQMTIADGDHIELSNLQRQIMFEQQQQGKNKAIVLCEQLKKLNNTINYQALPYYLVDDNLQQQVNKASLVLDCTDNLNTRYQINQACIAAKKVLISGAAIRWQGHLISFDFTQSSKTHQNGTQGGCYQCFRPKADSDEIDNEQQMQTCSNSGIIGPVVGMIGILQALEAIKHISGSGLVHYHQLQQFDGLTMQWQRFNIPKKSDCPLCNQYN